MRLVRSLDWLINCSFLTAFSLGALILFSIEFHFFYNQLFFFSLGIFFFLFLASLDYRIFASLYFYLYGAAIILLLSTFIFGGTTRGVTRWIKLGSFSFQPSELIKPLLVISFASLALNLDLKKGRGLFLFFLSLLMPLFLVFKQPDLGNSVVVFFIWLAIAFFRGLKKEYLFFGLVIFLAFLPLGWRLLKPYQKERVFSFLKPDYDSLGAGYNLIQAKIAVGSGGFLGKGLGSGSQSQLRFLPERHSDFIFACLAEELGFIGATLLLLALSFLILRIILLSQRSADAFGSLICIGAGSLLFFQTFVNIAMNLGLVPISGLTLPLVSYGGSSLLSTLILLGLVQSVSRQAKREKAIEIK